jgi:hypothetical protein
MSAPAITFDVYDSDLVLFGQFDFNLPSVTVYRRDQSSFFQMVEVSQVDVAGAGERSNSDEGRRVTGMMMAMIGTRRERWSPVSSMRWEGRMSVVIGWRRRTPVVVVRGARAILIGRRALVTELNNFLVDNFIVRVPVCCFDVVSTRLPEPTLSERRKGCFFTGSITRSLVTVLGMFVVPAWLVVGRRGETGCM